MEVSYGEVGLEEDSSPQEDEEGPNEYIVPEQELSLMCTSLLRVKKEERSTECQPLRIKIHSTIGDFLREGEDGYPHPQSKLSRLLEPLRQLHSAKDVEIEGPGSDAYKVSIMENMSHDSPITELAMAKVVQALDQGDKARDKGDLPLAVVKYRSGLEIILESNFEDDEEDEIRVRLQTRLAASYLKMRKLRMARIYTERVFAPLRSLNDKHFRQRTPLDVVGPRARYAELMAIAAQISLDQGQVEHAWEEIVEAITLDPTNLGNIRLSVQIKSRRNVLEERRKSRARVQERLYELQDKKAFGECFELLCLWSL